MEWIKLCLQQVQQKEEYYPDKVPCIYFTFSTLLLVLLSHNGFACDFPFIVAEVMRRKLDKEFNIPNLSFADTLYDVRRVGKNTINIFFHFQLVKGEHSFFTGWAAQEKKRLGLENLFHKCFPVETYNGNIIHSFECNNIKPCSSPSNGGCQSHEENFLLQLVASCFVQPEYPKQERYI